MIVFFCSSLQCLHVTRQSVCLLSSEICSFTWLLTGPQTETRTNFRRDWLQGVDSWWKTAHQGDKKSDRSIISSVSPSWWIQSPGVSWSDVEETNVKTQSKKSPGNFETQRHPPRFPCSVLTPHSKQELHIDLEAQKNHSKDEELKLFLISSDWQMFSKSFSSFYISCPSFLFQ